MAQTEDGSLWLKHLAYYVRTHEKALATALQQQRRASSQSDNTPSTNARPLSTTPTSSSTSSWTAAFSLGFGSSSVRPAKLCLTPNQLYYLLSRFEELGVIIGPMNVRLENLSSDAMPMEYVSFLTQAKRPKGRSTDADSLHSVSSVRSVMSSMSSMWSGLGISSNSAAKEEKRKVAEREDLRYLYSAFTKIPVLKLVLDHRTRRIKDYEEFPFDSAVPLYVFKNLSVLEVIDLDFRSFFGWDRLADQLRSLTVKRAGLDDLADLITNIVLDDMDKRRRRSCKTPASPVMAFDSSSPRLRQGAFGRSYSASDSPARHLSSDNLLHESSHGGSDTSSRPSTRPGLGTSSPYNSFGRRSSGQLIGKGSKEQRRSSSSSSGKARETPRTSSSNLLSFSGLPDSKWHFLRHLCVADNGMTSLTPYSLQPIAQTLQSLDLSSNLFTEIPDALTMMVSLRALSLSNCMLDSLHSLVRNPLPAVTVINLRGNRLESLAGIERLPSLERLELRENRLKDPTELARLTGMPNFKEVFVAKNPFTKTHSTYRVTIFNLFRRASGYTEDVIIDGTGPGYTEKKYLVDRAPEASNIPVIKPPTEDEVVTAKTGDAPSSTVRLVTNDETPPDATKTTPKPSPSKSRKAARRRVVDLSDSPKSPPSRPSYDVGSPDATGFVTALQTPHTVAKRRDTAVRKPTEAGEEEAEPLALADAGLSGEQYRKRIEALKKEYGNDWLNAMSHDGNPFLTKEGVKSPSAVS